MSTKDRYRSMETEVISVTDHHRREQNHTEPHLLTKSTRFSNKSEPSRQ